MSASSAAFRCVSSLKACRRHPTSGLPHLRTGRCQFATGQSGKLNFVTIDLDQGVRYAVFFDLMRWKKARTRFC
jgi:hypothetical protein